MKGVTISTSYPTQKTADPIARKPKGKFLNYIHNFRGLAILFVVGGHILLEWDDNSFSKRVLGAVWQNGTVLFMFIAGYLFQYLSAKYETTNYWLKKIRYVLLPYLIISIPAIVLRIYQPLYDTLILYPGFEEWSVLKKVGYYYVSGSHLLPLWFIPMITIFYVIAPVLIKIDRNPRAYYVLPLLVIISLIVPRDELNNIPKMFLHFLSVYIFGMFFSHFNDRVLRWSSKYWLLLTLSTVALMIATIITDSWYDPIMYLQKMFLCWFFVYWLWRFGEHIPTSLGTKTLADYSFGIFFLHYYFLLIIKLAFEYSFPALLTGSVLNWSIDFGLIIILNIACIALTKRVLGKQSRYVIGC